MFRSTPLISRPSYEEGDRCAQISKYVETQHDNENSVRAMGDNWFNPSIAHQHHRTSEAVF